MQNASVQDSFPKFYKVKASENQAIRPEHGPVLNPTGPLTWVGFDMVHLVEILGDKKLLQTNTQKRIKSQIKHAPCAWGCSKQSKYLPET